MKTTGLHRVVVGTRGDENTKNLAQCLPQAEYPMHGYGDSATVGDDEDNGTDSGSSVPIQRPGWNSVP